MKRVFTQDWIDWINTNVNAGRDKDGIFKILLDEGYDFDAISDQMEYKPSRPVEELVNPFEAKAAQERARRLFNSTHRQNAFTQTQTFVGNNGLGINPNDIYIPNGNRLASDAIDLRTIDHFLSEKECKMLIERIKSKMRPSSVSNYDIDTNVRTSQTCDLGWLDDPFVKDIDSRICKLLGIHPSYSEVLQGQYYEVGQEFKAHTDFFDPHEFETHCSEFGQRTFTVMIYLNDVEAGGETRFKHMDMELKPLAGKAVIWNNLKPDGTPNMNTLHQAKPVEKGYKAIITKWFRSTSPDANNCPMFIKSHNENVPNYTQTGIFKTTLKTELFEKVTRFYHENRDLIETEHVEGDFIVGAESAHKKRTMSSVVNLTPQLRKEIHDSLKPDMENWSGVELEPTFVYGIREYHRGAILKMHRDRIDTHIISAIINVDQDVDSDWPLIIEDNGYRMHKVFLKPGEIVFYEGGRLLHGRPIAFEGNSFANLFCHFKPIGYSPPTS